MVFGLGKKRESWSSRPLSMILPENVKFFGKKSRGILERASQDFSNRLVEDQKPRAQSSSGNMSVFAGETEPVTSEAPQVRQLRSRDFSGSRQTSGSMAPMPESEPQNVSNAYMPDTSNRQQAGSAVNAGYTMNGNVNVNAVNAVNMNDAVNGNMNGNMSGNAVNVVSGNALSGNAVNMNGAVNGNAVNTGYTMNGNMNANTNSTINGNAVSYVNTAPETTKETRRVPTRDMPFLTLNLEDVSLEELHDKLGQLTATPTNSNPEEQLSPPAAMNAEQALTDPAFQSTDTLVGAPTVGAPKEAEEESKAVLKEADSAPTKQLDNSFLLNPKVKVTVNHGVFIFDPSDHGNVLVQSLAENERFNPFWP